MISQPESAWVVNVGERRTCGSYKGVKVKAQDCDKYFDIYLNDVFYSSISTRSPVKAIEAAKAAIDTRELFYSDDFKEGSI